MDIFEKPYSHFSDVLIENFNFKRVERLIATKDEVDSLEENHQYAQDGLIKRFTTLYRGMNEEYTSAIDENLEIREVKNAKMMKAVYFKEETFIEGILILEKDGKFFNLGRLQKG